MKRKYYIEKINNTNITRITVKRKNKKGESLIIELTDCKNPDRGNTLPILWKKYGYTNKLLNTYICVKTYCTDSDGNCYDRYNPQIKLSEDKKRRIINFDWMLENTEDNKQKLIDEVIYRFESAI